MSSTWHPVSVAQQWAVQGGYLRKPVTLETKEIDTVDGVVHFVKVAKKDEWLLTAALGKGNNKGGLRRTELLDTIKDRVSEAAKSASSTEDSQDSAVAEPASEDPMELLDDDSPAPPKKLRKVYSSKRRKNHITHIDMPEHEPTAHPGKPGIRKVAVLAWSTNQTWLGVDDVPWLVRWLADEARTGGVEIDTANPLDALVCNCEAENVHIR